MYWPTVSAAFGLVGNNDSLLPGLLTYLLTVFY